MELALKRCPRCHVARTICVCDLLGRVPNRTLVRVLVHPKERRHPLGTLRFLELGLEQVEISTGFHHRPMTGDDMQRAVLLFPGPDAQPWPALQQSAPDTIVLLDGTWSQARALLRDNAWLQALRRCAVPEGALGRYRIRREPHPECLSTLEAATRVLGRLEPELGGLDALVDAFDAMQDRQLACVAPDGLRRRARPRAPARPIPDALGRHPERLVLVHGRLQGDGATRRLLSWGAWRLGTDETFFAVVRPAGPSPTASRLARIGLTPAQVDAGVSVEEFEARWRAFCRPDDVVAGWTRASLDYIGAPGALALKEIYCNWRQARSGHIVDVLAREGLAARPVPIETDVGDMLGRMAPIAERLVEAHAAQNGL